MSKQRRESLSDTPPGEQGTEVQRCGSGTAEILFAVRVSLRPGVQHQLRLGAGEPPADRGAPEWLLSRAFPF